MIPGWINQWSLVESMRNSCSHFKRVRIHNKSAFIRNLLEQRPICLYSKGIGDVILQDVFLPLTAGEQTEIVRTLQQFQRTGDRNGCELCCGRGGHVFCLSILSFIFSVWCPNGQCFFLFFFCRSSWPKIFRRIRKSCGRAEFFFWNALYCSLHF